MKVITYQVTLLEPTLVTELDGDPNSAVAFNFLPGSALRGAVIGKYIHQEKSKAVNYKLTADDDTVRNLFFNSKTRYLNGYLWPQSSERRSLPVPLSWQQEKDEVVRQSEDNIHDLSRTDSKELERPQSIGYPFCILDDDKAKLIKPSRHFAVHTARTRRFGRAMPQNKIHKEMDDTPGAVYRYESLAAEQTFAAAIICEDDSDAKELYDLLKENNNEKEEAVLGGSRTGGYGRVEFYDVEMIEYESWHEYEKDSAQSDDDETDDNQGEEESYDIDKADVCATNQEETNENDPAKSVDLGDASAKTIESTNGNDASIVTQTIKATDGCVMTVTLLSDALVRDENGQFVVDAEAIGSSLEAQMTSVTLTPQVDKCFMRGRVIGGFNRKWGLPLPQTLAVQMGSVFVFTAETRDEEKISMLVEKGIGERRSEGFGRIAVDWHKQPKLKAEKVTFEKETDSQALESESIELAQRMAARLLRRRLDAQVIEQSAMKAIKEPLPFNSQISRLRDVIHTELMKTVPDLNQIEKYLKDIEERATARKQFEKAHIGSQSLLKYLRGALNSTDEEQWKLLLDLQAPDAGYRKKVGGIPPEIPENLRAEYLLRYIDAVLARAAKQGRKED